MDKTGGKRRDISFRSDKNGKVVSYETCHLLDMERYQFINPIDIRKDYFDVEWATDFVLHFADGSIGIREIVTEAMLSKRANIEKLEFSRRYWSASESVKDWKIVLMSRKEN